ncbi:hypothetical protein [Myceligenerans crystallogenes]|uniref:Deazaflavin-dependent oxidoreductase, nitroreductase family n=1 Tax=Myceligenerans crystallogenes TaxID=316335 RepID=A0ABN2NEL4_9MICO
MTTFLTVLAWLAGALVLAVLLGIGFILTAMRTKNPRMLRAVRHFNRSATNKLQLRTAGKAGSTNRGLLHHRGRTSGREYVTPLGPSRCEGGFEIALPYGTDVDWLRNLRAAGSAVLETGGRRYRVDRPEIVPLATTGMPDATDPAMKFLRVDQALRVRAVELPPPPRPGRG